MIDVIFHIRLPMLHTIMDEYVVKIGLSVIFMRTSNCVTRQNVAEELDNSWGITNHSQSMSLEVLTAVSGISLARISNW